MVEKTYWKHIKVKYVIIVKMDVKLLRKTKTKLKKAKYEILLKVVDKPSTNVIFTSISNPKEFFDRLKIYDAVNTKSINETLNVDSIVLFIIQAIRSNNLSDLPASKEFINHGDMFYTDFFNLSILGEKCMKIFSQKISLIKEKIIEKSDISLIEIIQEPEQFTKKVDEYASTNKGNKGQDTLSLHWKDSSYSPIMALFNHNQQFQRRNIKLYNRWNAEYEKVRKVITDKYDQNKPQTESQDIKITYEDAVKIRDALEDGSDIKLLLTLLTDMAPLRSDYGNVKLIKSKSVPNKFIDENYIHNDVLYLNKYKTSGKYGQLEIPLSKMVLYQLRLSLKKKPRAYLFSTSDNKAYVEKYPTYFEKEFNKWANSNVRAVFKNPNISLTYFRHIFISRPDLGLLTKTNAEKKKIAILMGHSLTQQSKYLWIEEDKD